MKYYFEGIERFDFLFENPNKTALFLSSIIFLLVLLHRRNRWINAIICFSCAIMFYLLLSTYSRGGILGFGAAVFVLFFFEIRNKKSINLYLTFLVALFIFSVFHHHVFDRIIIAFSSDDSVRNRLLLWRSFPQMLIDAPNGWGLGSSGEAYMQWYQPLLLGEQYRTMVSSHITYFLEFQFFFKFAYIFLWTFVFYASFPRAKNIKSSLCFSFFVMFFISGIFSSVYEEFILLIPFICVAVLVVYRNAFIFSKRHITCIFLLSAFLFLGVYAISYALYSQSHIHYSDKTVKIGNGTFNITIFYDKKVFGKYYGKKIRNYIASHSNCSIYVLPLEHFSKIAQESNFLMISSYDEYLKFVSKDTQIVFINPELNIDKISTFTNSRILCGEFSSSLLLVDAYTVKYEILKGMGNYIPNWTDFLPSIILISDE